ncbi:FeoB-associated Cys-rich membrane protein [Anaerofustis butyriciformans]|uniref:FeoB-associated Cys-rich membrane protein n=1 Tax=Anaerofustis TaxID=264995 RepID=UPI003F8BF492
MINIIVTAVILLIIGLACTYIIKEKKKGTRCIGCPSAGSCQSKKCSCHNHE